MALTFTGLQGTVTDTQQANQFLLLPQHVYGADDFRVTTGANRQVSVATGNAWGHYFRVTNDAAIPLTLTPPATGGQWWAIAIRREWSPTNTALVEAIDTGVSTDGTVPKLIPKAVVNNPAWQRKTPGTAGTAQGTHQVLAFVHVRAADTTLTLFDTRLIRGAGTFLVETLHALSAVFWLGYLARAALLTVGQYATPSGGYHERSVWMIKSDGQGGLSLFPHGRIIGNGVGSGGPTWGATSPDVLGELTSLVAAGLLSLQDGESAVLNTGDGNVFAWDGTSAAFRMDARTAKRSAYIGTQDLNALTVNGQYRSDAAVNAPTDGWCWYRVQSHDDNWVHQEAVGFTGSATGRMFRRSRRSGTWDAWREVPYTDNPVLVNPSRSTPIADTGAYDNRLTTTKDVRDVLTAGPYLGNSSTSTPNNSESNTRTANTQFVHQMLADRGLDGSVLEISNSDLNSRTVTGWYAGYNVGSAPGSSWFYFMVQSRDPNYVHQTAYNYFNEEIWERRRDGGNWSYWRKKALVFGAGISYINGAQDQGSSLIKVGDLVAVTFAVKIGSRYGIDVGTFANLPGGFRPGPNVDFVMRTASGATVWNSLNSAGNVDWRGGGSANGGGSGVVGANDPFCGFVAFQAQN